MLEQENVAVSATFADRDFTSYRIFFVRDTTFVELVATPEDDEPELVSRFTQTGQEKWMTHEVKRGDPPVLADEIIAAKLDGLLSAMRLVNQAWLET